MSAATKRPRPQQAASRSAASPHSKRLKSSHGSAATGLENLVDEDARAGRRLHAKLTNGVGKPAAHRVDESHASAAQESPEAEDADVTHGRESEDVIAISSGDESSDLEEDGEEAEEDRDQVAQVNGHAAATEDEGVAGAEDEEMADADHTEEPTFGDMLQTRHPSTIDVSKTARSENGPSGSLVPANNRQLVQPPTAGSLGTVLTQALKTNDKDLLESCFAMSDVNAIRATIQRQQSPQIATLLQRIAERIHKRPGRAGRLMIWIQWSLVTHGGYLANQPELMKKLKSLAQVTRERANGLQPLLHLKGKLDLLSAQLEARRHLHAQNRAAHSHELGSEQDVLFIEGQETAWSSDDEDNEGGAGRRRKKLLPTRGHDKDQDSDADADLPNGFINGVEDDSSADEDEEGLGGLVDVEAEEGDSDEEISDDDGPQSEESEEDEDTSEDDESEVDAVKQAKPQTLQRKK